MSGTGPPEIHSSTSSSFKPAARSVDRDGFTSVPIDRISAGLDHPSEASSSRRHEGQDGARSTNFLQVLKERVQGVLNTQQISPSRISSSGYVSQSTVPTEHLASSRASIRNSLATSVNSSIHHLSQELQMLPLHHTGHESEPVDISGTDAGGKTPRFEDFYSINLTPKQVFLKFRQQVEGLQLGTNFEVHECNTKLVFKPVKMDRKWKFICEPKHGDVRLLTKKIPIGPLLNLQVGIGHDWHTGTTGWKWKVTSVFGGNGETQIRHKTRLSVVPGFDLRVGWNAEYVLPNLHGGLGTGDPAIGLHIGHLYASIERFEAIYTHVT